MTQQCQLRATITGQSAAGIGAVVGMAQKWAGSNGGDRRAEAAVESPAGSRPLRKRQEIPLPRSEDDAPVPRTARTRATGATRIARPVALTPRQSKRHLSQARRASFHLQHDNTSEKVCHLISIHILSLFLFLSLATGTRKGDASERILLGEGSGPQAHY
jgi:hypothetical protein